jgi:hypothetical protein
MEEFFTRVFTNLAGRVGGPMTFRVILQPLMATLLAIRAGLADARQGRPPYFWTIITDPSRRVSLLREGWKAVARVFVLAIVMDVIYQLIVERWLYPGETLIVAIVLAVIPYLLLRGVVTRIARRLRRQPEVSADRPST